MGMIKEFKDFAMKGNVVDMAVGVIIGGAFGKIVSSMVKDIIMPVVGLLTGGMDFSKMKYVLQEAAVAKGDIKAVEEVAINYGTFLNFLIDFLIVAFVIFIAIKAMNNMMKKEEEKPAEPAKPSDEVVLLTEIRDSLAKS